MRTELIRNKLAIIRDNIKLIKENLPDKFEDFMNLGLIKDGIYKRIEASIQEIINICSIINSDLKLGIPSNRDQIIFELENNNILSSTMARKVKQMKGFKNFLVHRYGQINDKVAFINIRREITDFCDFDKEISDFLKKFQGNKI
ncbi:MAG: type VII toxin-antitoxin system HepT family RNase toxin [Promethearchaeota archaeon]